MQFPGRRQSLCNRFVLVAINLACSAGGHKKAARYPRSRAATRGTPDVSSLAPSVVHWRDANVRRLDLDQLSAPRSAAASAMWL
jgi:hypothetical protein